MPLTTPIEFTRLLQLHNLLASACNEVADSHAELTRLRDEEMITVRHVPDPKLITALGEEIERVGQLMQAVASGERTKA